LTLTQIEEAKSILKIVDKYFPKRFDGKESIKWLHRHTTQGRQDEWAAFFFEEYCFPLITNFLGGWKGPSITRSKRFDYQRDYIWDLKLEANVDKNGNHSDWIILNDERATRRMIQQEAGIGFVIATADFSFDKNDELRKWRIRFENKPKKKTGPGKTRILKKSGEVIELRAIIIKNHLQIEEGIRDGWLGIFKQGRNANGQPRPPKFKLNLAKIPSKYVVKDSS